MKDLNTLNETKNELQKEVKELKKERLIYTFLNILKPSYPANFAAGAQLCGYLGIIIGLISLATGSYLGSLPATLAILGGSAAFTTVLTVAAYVCYDYKDYLYKKKQELKEIEFEIDNYDNQISNSKSKTNMNVNSVSNENKNQDKSISDKISELKEYKDKITNYEELQKEEQINKKK